MKRIREKNWLLNAPDLMGSSVPERIMQVHDALQKKVTAILDDGDMPVSISGDCCTSMAVLGALQKKGLHPWLLWLDAHGDFNTEETTITGFLGGMPLAMISGRGDQQFIQSAGVTNLDDADIILSDAGDPDPAENELIESSGIHRIKQVRDIKHFHFGNRPLYIHFDVDIIHTQDAPALLYPVAAGPRKSDLSDLFRYLNQTQSICALSVTCWEPLLDTDNRTGETCMELIKILSDPAGYRYCSTF